jgi:hypothetical protein
MTMDDKQLERFLAEFEPRAPRPLPAVVPSAIGRRRRLLAAAAVVLAASASFWYAARRTNTSQQPQLTPSSVTSSAAVPAEPRLSLLQLTRLGQNDPRELDVALDDLAQGVLPTFRGKDSTLAALGKE